jgi:ABC-2 type transport system permease protein
MAKLWAVFKREYLERVRTRWFVFATVFGPVIFGLMLFLPPWLSRKGKASNDLARIAVIDASGSGLGRRVAVELNGGLFGDSSRTQVMEVAPGGVAAAESLATKRVMKKEVLGYLVLDSASTAGQRARYAGRNASQAFDVGELQRVVRSQVTALRLENAGMSPALARSIMAGGLRLDTERLSEQGRGGSGALSILFALVVAFLLYISIFIYGQNVLRGVMEEKQTRVAEIIVSSIPSSRLLQGKVLGVGAVGITQLVLWGLASVVLAKVRAPVLAHFGVQATTVALPSISFGIALLLLAYFLLGYVFYAALFAAVGAVVNTEQEAQQVQMPVAMLLVASALVIQPILFSPDGQLARVMSLLPFSAPIAMPLRLTVIPLSPTEVALSLLSLVVGCWVAMWVAARIYRTGLLMYGKRPTLGEMVRWVRYAR